MENSKCSLAVRVSSGARAWSDANRVSCSPEGASKAVSVNPRAMIFQKISVNQCTNRTLDKR